MTNDASDEDDVRNSTLEAFADTIIPGEKRWPGDRAVAGASTGGGAVSAGALALLEQPGTGMSPALDSLAVLLNEHAREYAEARGDTLDDEAPPFVALSFANRTELVQQLTAPDHPEKSMWVGLALFSNMAYDSAAHLNLADAFAQGHPGLLAIGYARPDATGVYQFPQFSYGRALAPIHPLTTATGSPA